ncbi:hypothetical protein, partial [Escherichia coli]|uniref:hypothetical protein n=1 Tax=Escherichia coli TaxID=562 RepID=UPI00197B8FC5
FRPATPLLGDKSLLAGVCGRSSLIETSLLRQCFAPVLLFKGAKTPCFGEISMKWHQNSSSIC